MVPGPDPLRVGRGLLRGGGGRRGGAVGGDGLEGGELAVRVPAGCRGGEEHGDRGWRRRRGRRSVDVCAGEGFGEVFRGW